MFFPCGPSILLKGVAGRQPFDMGVKVNPLPHPAPFCARIALPDFQYFCLDL
jgi:hypothetical protein